MTVPELVCYILIVSLLSDRVFAHYVHLESESLHADVREGRLASNADDRKFDSDREERNPPSNG